MIGSHSNSSSSNNTNKVLVRRESGVQEGRRRRGDHVGRGGHHVPRLLPLYVHICIYIERDRGR